MRFLAGLLGAVVGIIVGSIASLCIVARAFGADDFGAGFSMVIFGPIGLIAGLIAGNVCGLKSFDFLRRPDPERKLTKKKWALRGALYAGLPLLTVLMFQGWQHANGPPTDAAMLMQFHTHRAQFDELARMVQHDNPHGTGSEGKGLWRVDQDWTGPDKPETVGVSPARIADYRQKLRAAGVPRGFQTADKGEIDFYCYLTGSAISDETDKSFAYLPKPPATLRASLDNCGPNNCGPDTVDGSVYRHIDGNWYLYYDYRPD